MTLEKQKKKVLKKYTEIKDEIRKHNEDIKNLREELKEYTDEIIELFEVPDNEKTTIEYNDYEVSINRLKKKKGFSRKQLKELILSSFGKCRDTDALIYQIEEGREKVDNINLDVKQTGKK